MPIRVSNQVFYTTGEAAEQIGRSRDTVLRWIRSGEMRDVEKDGKANRLWTDTDIEELKKVRDIMLTKKLKRGT
jgi:excisionase family DNA binding protein